VLGWPGALLAVEPVVALVDGQRREIQPLIRGDGELLPLDAVISGQGIGTRAEAGNSSLKLMYQGREVTLFHKKSLASVGGDLRLLSAPSLNEDGHWFIAIDAVPRLLGPLLGKPCEWRAASRVLLIGNTGVPRLQLSTAVSGDLVRVVIEASERVQFRVEQKPGRVTVAVLREAVDVSFHQERLTGGIVDLVQYVGGRENLFAVTLGRRFGQVKAIEDESPPRLTLEFEATAETAAKPGAPTATTVAPAPVGQRAVRTVVIDPGHGGSDTGAKGPAGTFEKDVALNLARRLRAQLVNNLGLQVFLTRDSDLDLGLDQRAALANNYKADLFVSLHANASRSQGVKGSEVYFLSYQASDDESRRVALAEGALEPGAAGSPVAGGDVALILWDMAQAEHLEESSALASRLLDELAEATGKGRRGVKQAPFRVLVGAAMPAALVEIAFISNPEEEQQLLSEAWLNRVASALTKGIGRYESERARRTGQGPARSGP